MDKSPTTLMKVSDFVYTDEADVTSEASFSSDESTASLSHWTSAINDVEIVAAAGTSTSGALAFLEKILTTVVLTTRTTLTMATMHMHDEIPKSESLQSVLSAAETVFEAEAEPAQTSPARKPALEPVAAAAKPAEPEATRSLRDMIEGRAWAAASMASLYATMGPVLCGVAASVVLNKLFGKGEHAPAPNGKTVIVTGGKMTKSLVICRALKAQGCRVVLVETSKYWMVATRQSRSVDRFVTVPVPEKDTDAFLKAIRALAIEEEACLYVPVCSPVASQYEALVADVLPEGCHSWSLSPEMVQTLDDKVEFGRMARELNLPVPDSRRICSPADAHAFNNELHAKGETRRYVFKNLNYDSMHRLDLFTMPCEREKLQAYIDKVVAAECGISVEQPWLVQAFVNGPEYSSSALVKDGQVLAFTDNEASISCFNYKHAAHPQIRGWVETLCKAHNISGIICIDFMVEDGTALAIECNPRFSSNNNSFYSNERYGEALLKGLSEPAAFSSEKTQVQPLAEAQEVNWLFCDAYYALSKPGYSMRERLGQLYTACFVNKDAYFDVNDPLPFLALHYLHVPVLLMRNLLRGNKWAKIDLCIGKMTEENGD